MVKQLYISWSSFESLTLFRDFDTFEKLAVNSKLNDCCCAVLVFLLFMKMVMSSVMLTVVVYMSRKMCAESTS